MAVTGRTPFIAGNWKMNLDHQQAIAFVQKLHWALKEAKHLDGTVEVGLFPPFTDLRTVQTLLDADKIPFALGAQDLSTKDSGAYTGEVSGAFLKKLNCAYVIIGHSERREYHAETDEVVAAKVQAALRHGLVPVICVGETSEDLEKFGASAVPVGQLEVALEGVPADADIVVAYEPVWAIGSGQAATPEQAQEVCAKLREVIAAKLGTDAAERTRVLYGGSVKSDEHRELHARARRRRRARRRGEPRGRRVRGDHQIPEARRRLTALILGDRAPDRGAVKGLDLCRSSSSSCRCSSASPACC